MDERLLIPFKAFAFLDLTERAARGEPIDRKHIKKHRSDVFRLLQLLPADAVVELAPTVRADLARFIDIIADDATLDPRSFDVGMSRDEGIAALRSAYSLA